MNCNTPGFPVLHCLLEFSQFMSIVSMMPSNRLILCCPLLLLSSIFPSIWVFFNQLAFFFFFNQVTKVLELRLQHQSFQWIFSWFLKSFLRHHNFLVGFHAVRSLEVGSSLGHLYHVLRFSCLLSHSHTTDPSAPAFCLCSEEDKGPRDKCVHLLCLNSCLWALPSPFHSSASFLSHGSQRWEMECINQAWALIEGEKGSWLHNCPPAPPHPTGFLYFFCLMVSWLV